MAINYDSIFEAIEQKCFEAWNSADVNTALSIYDEHAVVVDKKSNKIYHGLEQIKDTIVNFIKIGQVEYKTSRRVFTGLDDNCFYADVDFILIYADAKVEFREFEHIFESIAKKNVEAYNAADREAAAEMYDEQGVIVDKNNNKVFFGSEQIKEMIDGFIMMGKVEYKTPRKVFTDLGGNRFHVDVEFITTFVDAGHELKGSSQHLYEHKDGNWKCVYEIFEMY